MRGDQAYGSLVLEQTSAQLVMLYDMGSKKHLHGRIVPLRVPFLGYACDDAHVRTANKGAGYKTSGDLRYDKRRHLLFTDRIFS